MRPLFSVSRDGWDDQSRAMLVELWKGNAHSERKMGEILGCSKNSIHGQAVRMGLKHKPSPIIRRQQQSDAPRSALDLSRAARRNAGESPLRAFHEISWSAIEPIEWGVFHARFGG